MGDKCEHEIRLTWLAYFNLFKSISSMPASVLQLEKFNNGVVCLYSHTLGTGCATGLYAREYTFYFPLSRARDDFGNLYYTEYTGFSEIEVSYFSWTGIEMIGPQVFQ